MTKVKVLKKVGFKFFAILKCLIGETDFNFNSLKLKLFIHIIQDALMIFAYPYPEQTGVNKLLFFTPRKTGTAFQMI